MRPAVIGVGNEERGDDAVGLEVARLLRAQPCSEADVFEADGEASGLMELWRGRESVVLVDATSSGAPAGSILRLDAGRDPLPARRERSCTHGFGVTEAVELARALGELPSRTVVFGVEGQGWELGAPMSPPVARAVPEVARRVRQELSSPRKGQALRSRSEVEPLSPGEGSR